MADGYDRYENEGGGGGSFVMGLLTGTVLGAGLGMLFAPKAGSELRNQLSEQAGNIRDTASEGYRRASETAGDWAEKGRDMVGQGQGRGQQGRGRSVALRARGHEAARRTPARAAPADRRSADPTTAAAARRRRTPPADRPVPRVGRLGQQRLQRWWRLEPGRRHAPELKVVTRPAARAVANVVLAAAGVAAAYVIVTTPSLRRLAIGAMRLWLGASIPAYLLRETGRAWVESGRAA